LSYTQSASADNIAMREVPRLERPTEHDSKSKLINALSVTRCCLRTTGRFERSPARHLSGDHAPVPFARIRMAIGRQLLFRKWAVAQTHENCS
jgi:hypothetical protein